METEDNASKYDNNSHVLDGFIKVMLKINKNEIDDEQPPTKEG